jgi:hypothetical protein
MAATLGNRQETICHLTDESHYKKKELHNIIVVPI